MAATRRRSRSATSSASPTSRRRRTACPSRDLRRRRPRLPEGSATASPVSPGGAGPMAAKAGILVLHAWWGRNADVLARAYALRAEGYIMDAPALLDALQRPV